MTISVLTLNLWHDAGPWPERAALIRRWLVELDPDVVAFQEALRGPGLDQASELVDGLGYEVAYAAASPWHRPDTRFGNAIASRWPILARDTLSLPGSGDAETRVAIGVTLDAPHGPLPVHCTHLHWRFDHGVVREAQVVALCEWAAQRSPLGGLPPLLLGDFNAEPDSSEIRYLCGLQSLEGRSVHFVDAWKACGEPSAEAGAGTTWSNRNDYARDWLEPDRRIDYVFAGPPRRNGIGMVTTCRVVCDAAEEGVWPSDHFGVYAELRSEPIPHLADRPG